MQHRLAISAVAFVLMLGVVVGFLANFASSEVPEVGAAVCGIDPNCTPPDNTATAILLVNHAQQGGSQTDLVEPDTGETWGITATWSTEVGAPRGCDCESPFSDVSVTATVTWTDGTGWSVGCNGCDSYNGPIRSISICNSGSCGGDSDLNNGYAYKLLVDIDYAHPDGQYWCGNTWNDVWLSDVEFTTSSVDDGNEVDASASPCTEGSSVSPTSQTWSDTDDGGFDCDVSCDDTGASVTIYYQ